MKKFGLLAVVIGIITSGCSCERVPAGHVGIKVYQLGSNKGVDHEVLGVGRYTIGVNEDLFLFPTFEQNPKYSLSDNDSGAPFNFQTKEGMNCEADFAVTYTISPDKAAQVFQRYRLGVEEINKGPLRNIVRDALNEVTSTLEVEAIYGSGKTKMVDDLQKLVQDRTAAIGVSVSQVSLLGSVRLPDNVTKAINQKLEATQRAQQRENELREAKAQAEKDVATAEGEAQKTKALASGEAEATLTRAQAQAKANRILSESLTPSLIEYRKIDKWNGELPQFSGNVTPLVSIAK